MQQRQSKSDSRKSPGESVQEFREDTTSMLISHTATLGSPPNASYSATSHRMSTASSDGLVVAATDPLPSLEFWPSTTLNMDGELDATEFMLPSLPIDSPSSDDSFNLFAAIQGHDLSPVVEAVEIWPKSISQEALLPWIDVYFRRLHPTVPVLSRTMIYQEMLLRTHHCDPQFGAMLLALCAFAMTQPVQIHEVASTPSRSVQARMLLEESLKMRMTVDFGESPTVYMILTSFFIFACLFGSGQHRAANHRLREAVDLANSLAMHLPQAYDSLDPQTRDQWLRTYLVLSVTERAYALQKRHTISFRGSPAVNACFMRAFGSFNSSSVHQDQTDAIGMTGLLYLMETFDAIDESVVECWAGYCKYSDGHCEAFDRRRALRMFRAQQRAREDCLVGSISFEPSASLLPLHQLLESQQADISVTQFWLLNRLWELCMSHGLLRDNSEHTELRLDFAYHVARKLLAACDVLSLPSMEVHGVGLVEKIFDIAMGLIKAMSSSTQLSLEFSLSDYDPLIDKANVVGPTVRVLLQRLHELVQNFRGGDHDYVSQFTMTLSAIPGYSGTAESRHSVA
ncbi:hypothetical protein D6C77_01404 [Aureobasidium pullulans]|nr:hypothetical protein D6D12_02642 [Aureobasidium pullulans]THX36377.1 hypothetical protein D6D11_09445 [Aureobasidium pullulans]THX81718.1 hypothetical protein D6D04_03914 [Aureobasidium pullulans]TIA64489.1 hypothetical protein D6C77_01404 [Aureobasidium pullulans]